MVKGAMEDVDFSDAFCRFVQTQIPGVDAAELLLLTFHNPDVAWQAEQAAERLPESSAAAVAKHLEAFRAAGLLDASYRFRPGSAELQAHVTMLAKAYEERPVTLIRLIYALRDRKIRSFADAFKLRKS
jgi:hypothetical protein